MTFLPQVCHLVSFYEIHVTRGLRDCDPKPEFGVLDATEKLFLQL